MTIDDIIAEHSDPQACVDEIFMECDYSEIAERFPSLEDDLRSLDSIYNHILEEYDNDPDIAEEMTEPAFKKVVAALKELINA